MLAKRGTTIKNNDVGGLQQRRFAFGAEHRIKYVRLCTLSQYAIVTLSIGTGSIISSGDYKVGFIYMNNRTQGNADLKASYLAINGGKSDLYYKQNGTSLDIYVAVNGAYADLSSFIFRRSEYVDIPSSIETAELSDLTKYPL